MLRKEKQRSAREGEGSAQAKAVHPQLTVGKTDTPIKAGVLSTMLRVFHPLIVFDAYTFRWLGFDPREHENTREQAFTKVTNVGLISALVFTVWASWLQVVADTSFENYGESWADDTKGIASSFLCAGIFFLLFSVINSVLVLLAVNETEDDLQAMQLFRRLDLWLTLPSIYFYLGVACGSFGFLIWFSAAFPLKYRSFHYIGERTLLPVSHPVRLRHSHRSWSPDSLTACMDPTPGHFQTAPAITTIRCPTRKAKRGNSCPAGGRQGRRRCARERAVAKGPRQHWTARATTDNRRQRLGPRRCTR